MITKAWGTDQCIKQNASFELHRISIMPGGFCSRHRHQHKWNGFLVESGKMTLMVWRESQPTVIELSAGDYAEVEPGRLHQFMCDGKVVAYEMYWTQLDASDIVRESTGGRYAWQ